MRDREIARICAWLKANGLTASVFLSGRIELRKKAGGALVKTL